MNAVILTAVGGPAAENAIQNLKNASPFHVIGTDMDRHLINLSSADVKTVVPSCGQTKEYAETMLKLYKTYRCRMFLPVSDAEIDVVSHNSTLFPPSPIPNEYIVDTCQDKALLYQFLDEHGISVPTTCYTPGDICKLQRPQWIRATKGAGGRLSHKITTVDQLKAFLILNYGTQFMMSDYLGGRDFSYTSLWVDGKLCFSVSKERLGWVYKRIGTAAAQKTVVHPTITRLCEETIQTLIDIFEPNLTAIMMVDLKEDSETGEMFVTEINCGRTGTVSFWYTLGSLMFFGDNRANFHYQLYNAHTKQPYASCGADALPADMFYIRHIDLGALFIYKDNYLKFSPFPERVKI